MPEIAIRPWTMTDAPAMAAIMNNPNIQPNLRDGIPFPYAESDAVDFIRMIGDAEPDMRFDFAVTYGGEVVGSIGVFRKTNVYRRTAEMGYCMAEAYWGRGIMTEAVKLVCQYIFTQTDILRISAEIFSYNEASGRVLEKTGFQLEGIMRQNVVKNEQVFDAKLYAILRSDVMGLA